MILAGNRATIELFTGAFAKVMRSPISWHDRTPVSIQHKRCHGGLIDETGRIISRLTSGIFLPFASKSSPCVVSWLSQVDVQRIDNTLAMNWNTFLRYIPQADITDNPRSLLSLLGTFALIVYTYPYLALIFIPLAVFVVSV